MTHTETKMANDTYLEHSQHIVGENGKRVPFFRNEKNCSTCYTERRKILNRSERTVLQGRGWDYEPSEYRIND